MNNLVRRPPQSSSDDFLAPVMSRREEAILRMQLRTELLKLGMEQASQIYAMSEHIVLNTLSITEAMKKGGEPVTLTREQMAHYESLRSQYLQKMSALADYASNYVIQQAMHAPIEREGPLQNLLDTILND